jgi:hypothetical protein
MNIGVHNTGVKEIESGNPLFTINSGIVVSHRAALKISQRCPENYRNLIAECVGHGWIKPVAYVTDEEYMLMKLSN